MKYSIHDYAKALEAAIIEAGDKGATQKQSAIVKNFLELVKRNGDEARLKKILDEARRLLQGR